MESVLTEEKVNINASDSYGRTELHRAAARGDLESLKHLLNQGASCSVKDVHENTPLHSAAYNGHQEIITLLLIEGVEVDPINCSLETPLCYGVYTGHLEVVTLLLAQGAALNVQGLFSQSLLHDAASRGYVEIVELLLERGVAVDTQDRYHKTPLHSAAEAGHVEVVERLLAQGAQIDAEDKTKHTPLYWAAYHGNVKIVRLLLDRGAKTDAHNNQSKNSVGLLGWPLGSVTCLLGLKKRETFDYLRHTMLYAAASRGHAEVVVVLLETVSEEVKRSFFEMCIKRLGVAWVIQLMIAGFDTQPNGRDYIEALARQYPAECAQLKEERASLVIEVKELVGKDPITSEYRISDREVPAFLTILPAALKAIAALGKCKKENYQGITPAQEWMDKMGAGDTFEKEKDALNRKCCKVYGGGSIYFLNRPSKEFPQVIVNHILEYLPLMKAVDCVMADHPKLEKAKAHQWVSVIQREYDAFESIAKRSFEERFRLG